MQNTLKQVHSIVNKIRAGHWSLLLVFLGYLLFSVYYMGPSVWNCTSTLYGFGDNTGGPVWKLGLEPQQPPLGGYQNVTNFPAGESLYSPVNYSLAGQSLLIWGTSRALGPVCGYNTVNMLGFVASALVMFGFMYALFRNKWIAFLAGYAVSFAPYFQMKVGGHPGYGFQALLIGLIWIFFNLVRKQRKRDAVYLSLLLAACFYFDPYFSLLAGTILAPLLLVWLGLSAWRAKRNIVSKEAIMRQLRLLALSGGIFALLMVPLGVITLIHGQEISGSVAAYRGNVLFEAKSCSNLPHEYALPFVLHPIFTKIAGDEYTQLIDAAHNGFTCGIGEDTVGVSLIVLTVVAIGLTIFLWERINRRRIRLPISGDKQLVFLCLIAIGVFAAIMALPPVKIGPIPTPSYVLLHFTTTWRTLTRLFVVVNIAEIAIFSLLLAYGAVHFKKYKKLLMIIFALLFVGIFIEYQAFRPFAGNGLSTFSYSKDVPEAYTWLKGQKGIHEVAEYPLERSGGESNAMAYYLSMQVAHKKKLFNGNIPTTYEEKLRESLKDISDDQTQAVLYSLGIDAVVIHGLDKETVSKIPGLEVLHATPQPSFNILAFTPLVKHDDTVIVKIKPRPAIKTMLSLDQGFARNTTIIKSSADWSYEALNNSVMGIRELPGSKPAPVTKPDKQCFSVRIAGEGNSTLTVTADGTKALTTNLGTQYQRVQVMAKDYVKLSNEKGFNMQVRDLGCSNEEMK